MDFDEPLNKVDYWAELEKQVLHKKYVSQKDNQEDKKIESEIVNDDNQLLNNTIKSEEYKKEMIKKQ